MESDKQSNIGIEAQYFPIGQDEYVFMQMKLSMPQEAMTSLQETGGVTNDKQAIILCLDKSGSMAGKPFEGLKLGAMQVAESIFEKQEQSNFYTFLYGDKVHDQYAQSETYEDYCAIMKKIQADECTNFACVFDSIMNLAEQPYDSYSIIFFTDGQDNMNEKPKLQEKLLQMQAKLSDKKSRFLTIGFTEGHDAKFLNQITELGSEMGNFFFIDVSQENYQQQIQECLVSSLNIASMGSKLQLVVKRKDLGAEQQDKPLTIPLQQSNQDTFDDEDQQQTPQQQVLEFKTEALVKKEDLENVEYYLMVGKNEQSVKLHMVEVKSPTPEQLVSAQVQYINKKIFMLVKQLQSANKDFNVEVINEQIKQMNNELNPQIREVLKIKDREIKTNLLSYVQFCKTNIDKVMEILRSNPGQFSNVQIAQLNDLAYKAIRSKRIQQQLDKRAVENQKVYKQLEHEMKKIIKGIDFDKLREQHSEIVKEVGDCFLSCNDTIEAIKAEDCMCIALDIARPEDAIVEPSKLIIKKIIPTYISAESFLSSALYSLNINAGAHGGFDVDGQGKLAQGVGREDITGVLPLYLFKEHWDIAQRKTAPILGYMCSLDIMGFNPDQQKVVPFLVLLKALQNLVELPSQEITQRLHSQILKTCEVYLVENQEARDEFIVQLRQFLEHPQFRTKEHISSVQVFIGKIYAFIMSGDVLMQYLPKDLEIGQSQMYTIFRYGIEEILRRIIKSDSIEKSVDQMLEIVTPGDYHDLCQKAYEVLNTQQLKFDEDAVANGEKETLQQLQERKKQQGIQLKELEKKEIQRIVKMVVNSNHWEKLIEDNTSLAHKLINSFLERFRNQNEQIIAAVEAMMKDQTDKKALFDLFVKPNDFDNTYAYFSILMQNHIHVDNAKRRKAINGGSYVDIKSKEDCSKALQQVLKKMVKRKIEDIRLSMKPKKGDSGENQKVLERFYNCNTMAQTDLYFESLKTMNKKQKRIVGYLLYSAKNLKPIPQLTYKLKLIDQLITIKERIVFKIWLHFVNNQSLATLDEIIAIWPEKEDYLKMHDNWTGADGKAMPKANWKDKDFIWTPTKKTN